MGSFLPGASCVALGSQSLPPKRQYSHSEVLLFDARLRLTKSGCQAGSWESTLAREQEAEDSSTCQATSEYTLGWGMGLCLPSILSVGLELLWAQLSPSLGVLHFPVMRAVCTLLYTSAC